MIRRVSFVLFVCLFVRSLRGSSVSRNELAKISGELWKMDKGVEGVVINLQGQFKGGEMNQLDDRAPASLFAPLPESALNSTESFSQLISLFDNFEADVRKKEVSTPSELAEVNGFMSTTMKSDVMKALYKFLREKDLTQAKDEDAFKKELTSIWFDEYPRGYKVPSSCGFEHVFVGEIRSSQVIGFHNWIRFYLAERAGIVDYLGYFTDLPITKGSDLLTFKFKWSNFPKLKGSLLTGSSPELEMALYTLCFYTRPSTTCRVVLNNKPLMVRTHKIVANGKTFIGTAYPAIS